MVDSRFEEFEFGLESEEADLSGYDDDDSDEI